MLRLMAQTSETQKLQGKADMLSYIRNLSGLEFC